MKREPTAKADLDVTALLDLPFTYPEVGATAGTEPPDGYHAAQQSRLLGSGAGVFDRATDALLSWRMHRSAGLAVTTVTTTGLTVAVGVCVRTTIGWPPLGVNAPCRVVYVVREPHRCGFAYGTLPGHPVAGEESFVVEIDPATGQVRATVRAFSRPASTVARIGGPLTRAGQRVGAWRYLASLAALSR